MKKLLFAVLLVLNTLVFAQTCSDLTIQLQAETETTCFKTTMTMLHDRLDRPYLYVANKENGLTIYNLQDFSNPTLIKQITKAELANLDVMNLSQDGTYLYLALGNTFNTNEASGMAIINISDPINASIEDSYSLPNSFGGSGIIKTEGNYAYLGAMGNGLIILDISTKSNIQFISQLIPQINWPDTNQDPAKVNARGMEIRNDTVYLCYDAGGFRIIDVTQKANPIEIGRYANPVMNGLPRAYNNIELDGNLAYIAVDYCGMEILDFSDVNNVQLVGWWNPYNCPTNNWFTCPVHANEIRLNKNCQQVFLSTGKSDMMVIDVSNPSSPDSCNFYGGVSNNIGTWGIDVYENNLFLSYICTFGIPFASNWSGFKSLTMTTCANLIEEQKLLNFMLPNPSTGTLYIQTNKTMLGFQVQQLDGKIVLEGNKTQTIELQVDVSNLSAGNYFLTLISNEKTEIYPFVKE